MNNIIELDFSTCKGGKKEREEAIISGEIIEFNPNNHRYRSKTNGKYLFSISSIANMLDKGEGFNKWIGGCAKEYLEGIKGMAVDEEIAFNASIAYQKKRDKAAAQGIAVHDFAESYSQAQVEGMPIPPIEGIHDKEVLNGINAFLLWVEERKVKFVSSERICAYTELGVAGRYDGIISEDDEDILIDYKTSNSVHDAHFIQLGGYLVALNHERSKNGEKAISKAILIHLNKETGEYTEYEVSADKAKLVKGIFITLASIKNQLKLIK